MATEEGIVIKTSAGTALVKTNRSSACESCSSSGSCAAKGDEMEVEAINSVGARDGDRIMLSFATTSFLKATFLLYIFPVICLVIGAVAGQKFATYTNFDESVLSAATGFVFFFFSVIMIKSMGNRMARKDEYRPVISKILRDL